MKLSAISLLLLVVGCSTNPPSDAGAARDGSGGSSSPTAGSGGSSGTVNVPIGGSSSAGTSSAGTSALGGASTGGSGGSAGTASGGSDGASSGAGGTSSAGTGGTPSAGGGGGPMLQTDITARFDNKAGTDASSPIPAILAFLSVVNTDGGNAHLDLLKVRYYFTNEAPALTFVLQNGFVQWPGNQVTVPVTGTVVKMADPKPTADSYLELTFQSTFVLDAGKTALIDFRLYNTPSQQPILIQSNDYSFNQTPTVDTDKIVLLYRDVVIWGVEP